MRRSEIFRICEAGSRLFKDGFDYALSAGSRQGAHNEAPEEALHTREPDHGMDR